jgi:hypothetical protein
MAKAWLEWYLQDGRIKVCRGERNDEEEVSVYEKGADNKYHMLIQVVGMDDLQADILAQQFVLQYDTEKIFSKGTGMGKAKAFLNAHKRPKKH